MYIGSYGSVGMVSGGRVSIGGGLGDAVGGAAVGVTGSVGDAVASGVTVSVTVGGVEVSADAVCCLSHAENANAIAKSKMIISVVFLM